jgi:hypothetical protein
MAEVACTSENHGDAMLIGCSNDFIVTHTTPWLNSATRTRTYYDI